MNKLVLLMFMLAVPLTTSSCISGSEAVDNSKPQTVCPVLRQGIECEINKEIHTDYNGRRIYACSEACINEFKQNPDKYIKLLEEQDIILEKTPGEKELVKHP